MHAQMKVSDIDCHLPFRSLPFRYVSLRLERLKYFQPRLAETLASQRNAIYPGTGTQLPLHLTYHGSDVPV